MWCQLLARSRIAALRVSDQRGLRKGAGRDGSWELDFVGTASCFLGFHLTGAILLYPSLFQEIKAHFLGYLTLRLQVPLQSKLRVKLQLWVCISGDRARRGAETHTHTHTFMRICTHNLVFKNYFISPWNWILLQSTENVCTLFVNMFTNIFFV